MFSGRIRSSCLLLGQMKYGFADVGSVTEELFSFDNIHNLNFPETHVLVLVLDLAPEVLVLNVSWF